jgi:hypothetical protein
MGAIDMLQVILEEIRAQFGDYVHRFDRQSRV